MNYTGQWLLLTECYFDHLNGHRAQIRAQDINEMEHYIFELDVPHPDDPFVNLWVNKMDGVLVTQLRANKLQRILR